MKHLVVIAAFIAYSLGGVPGQAQSGDQVVAEVGEQKITLGELRDYAHGRAYVYRYPERSEAYRLALQDLTTDHLKRIDFFASGLARSDSVIQQLQRIVTEELRLAYVKHRYEERYLNERTIREEHESMGRVVFYRQIVLRKPPGAGKSELDSLRRAVKNIRLQIETGAPFESLVDRYSREASSARSGGSSLRLTWEQTVRDPRAFILFHLSPGDVRSFEGPQSLSIALVERIDRVPVPPLDEVRDRIIQALHTRYAAEATRAYRGEWTALVDTAALRWNPDELKQVVDWSNKTGFFEGEHESIVNQHLSKNGDAVVLTDGNGAVLLSDIPTLINEVLTLEESGGHSTDFVKEFLLEAVRMKRLARRARELGLADAIWSPATSSPALAQAFVRIYNERYIDDRIPEPTEASLRTFYEAHADSLFYQLARVNTEIIVQKDKDEICALLDDVRAGVPFEEASNRRLIRSFQKTRDGEIEALFTREPPYLGEVAFGMQEGEIAGPVAYEDAEEGRLYAIVLATRRLEERQLTFDEARERVEEAFVRYHEARLAEDVASDLRKRYPVVVHHNVLGQLLGGSL